MAEKRFFRPKELFWPNDRNKKNLPIHFRPTFWPIYFGRYRPGPIFGRTLLKSSFVPGPDRRMRSGGLTQRRAAHGGLSRERRETRARHAAHDGGLSRERRETRARHAAHGGLETILYLSHHCNGCSRPTPTARTTTQNTPNTQNVLWIRELICTLCCRKVGRSWTLSSLGYVGLGSARVALLTRRLTMTR